MWESRVLQRAFERLELHEGKLSRAVLRGGGGGDVTSLPDTWVGNHPGLPGPVYAPCRVGKGRPAGSIELRVSPSPSKIPYGGFSPVRLQMDRQWRPSTTSRGLSAASQKSCANLPPYVCENVRSLTPEFQPVLPSNRPTARRNAHAACAN